jgi:hypothetical protein
MLPGAIRKSIKMLWPSIDQSNAIQIAMTRDAPGRGPKIRESVQIATSQQ